MFDNFQTKLLMRKSLLLSLLCLSLCVLGQEHFCTMPLSEHIKTVQVGVYGQKMSLPVIQLNNDTDVISISFDEMSHDSKNYYYEIRHCNADWTLSNIADMEAIDGFSIGTVSDYATSFNTTFLYTHYSLKFPNERVRFKVSGNYRVTVYEDNDPEKVVAVACFSVVDPKVAITATIRGNTDAEMNGRYQQLDFYIDNSQFTMRDVFSELKILVRQNNRYDNQVYGVQPTFTTRSKQSYVNNRALIFEGGNEYRSFDCSSLYTFSGNIDNIRYYAPYYHVNLLPDLSRDGKAYQRFSDVNGRYVVCLQNDDNNAVDADYFLVHFIVSTENPYFEGSLYICGDLNYNLFNRDNRMAYNAQHQAYEQTVLLKQGGYNYLYAFVKKGETAGSLQPIEGSLWQTQNEYTIYAYYRGWGERYDRLIGVQVVE
jgi:hypothetical protein